MLSWWWLFLSPSQEGLAQTVQRLVCLLFKYFFLSDTVWNVPQFLLSCLPWQNLHFDGLITRPMINLTFLPLLGCPELGWTPPAIPGWPWLGVPELPEPCKGVTGGVPEPSTFKAEDPRLFFDLDLLDLDLDVVVDNWFWVEVLEFKFDFLVKSGYTGLTQLYTFNFLTTSSAFSRIWSKSGVRDAHVTMNSFLTSAGILFKATWPKYPL